MADLLPAKAPCQLVGFEPAHDVVQHYEQCSACQKTKREDRRYCLLPLNRNPKRFLGKHFVSIWSVPTPLLRTRFNRSRKNPLVNGLKRWLKQHLSFIVWQWLTPPPVGSRSPKSMTSPLLRLPMNWRSLGLCFQLKTFAIPELWESVKSRLNDQVDSPVFEELHPRKQLVFLLVVRHQSFLSQVLHISQTATVLLRLYLWAVPKSRGWGICWIQVFRGVERQEKWRVHCKNDCWWQQLDCDDWIVVLIGF